MDKNYRRFEFVKDFKKSENEVLRKGDEIRLYNNLIYFNGGQVTPAAYTFLSEFLAKEMVKPDYLRETPIPYNKV
jgi:hypothetical protein